MSVTHDGPDGSTGGRIRGLVAPAVATLVAGAVLVGLGVWQLERLAWKEELVARIAARTTAPPQPLPPLGAWTDLKPADYDYRRVTLAGRFENADEATILRASADGPMFHVVTPLALDGGGTVLVDRGVVPPDRRDPSTRQPGQIAGQVAITGLMRPPESRNAFTPADAPATGQFYTRDPAAIAAHFHLVDAAPFVVDADATPNPGGWPKGGDTIVDIPNNHFSYAMTWFGLAFALAAVFASYAWRRLTRPVTSGEVEGGPTPAAPRA